MNKLLISIIVGIIMLSNSSALSLSDDSVSKHRIFSIDGNESILFNAEIIDDTLILTPKFSGSLTMEDCFAPISTDLKDYSQKGNVLEQKDTTKICKNTTYSQPLTIDVGKGDTKEEAIIDNKEDIIPEIKNIFTGTFNIQLDTTKEYYKIGTDSIIIVGDSSYSVNSSINSTTEAGSFHLNITDNASPYNSSLGYWDYGIQDNSSSTTAYDLSKNNIDGTYTAGAYVNKTHSIFGGSAEFTGTDEYINFGTQNSLAFTNTQPYSITLWVYPEDTAGVSTPFVSYSLAGGRGWLLQQSNDGVNGQESVEHCYYDGTNYNCVFGNDFSLVQDQWNFITLIYNGSNANSGRRLFINDVEHLNYRCGGGCVSPSSINYATLPFTHGSRSASAYLNGKLDEVMIFNTTITTAQATAIYRNNSARFKPTGEITLGNFNLGNNASLNISLSNWTNNFNGNITAKVLNKTEVGFNLTSGKILNYNITDFTTAQRQEANITIRLYSGNTSINPFVSPAVKGNITLDTYGIVQVPISIPSVNITYPLNITYNSLVTFLNYTLGGGTSDQCWYSLNNGLTNTSVTCGNNVSGLDSGLGQSTWRVYANNSAGTSINNVTFIVNDITNPIINLIDPVNDSSTQNNNVTFLSNFTDNIQIKNYTIYVWNSTGSIINSTFGNVDGIFNISNNTIALPYQDNFYWNVIVTDTSNNYAMNNTNWSIQYKINSISFNLTLNSLIDLRFSKIFLINNNKSTSAFDNRDLTATSSSTNYTTLSSRRCVSGTNCILSIDSINITEIPRDYNITLFSTPNMTSAVNITWSWNQSGLNAYLIDYGTDSNRLTNVSGMINMKNVIEYYSSVSSRANNYFVIKVRIV